MIATHRAQLRTILACIAVFVTVVLIRGWYVHRYALPLPFWDQWDSEGDFLLRPWIEGTLSVSDLWQPHNEHRILPTRLTSLMLYEITGQWNNLYSAFFDVLLAAFAAASALWLAVRESGLRGLRWLIVAMVLMCFAAPFAWENFLVGFQSQFYYLMLFAMASIALAAWRSDDSRAIATILLLAVLSLLTMASGLVTAAAVVVVYLVRHRQSPLPRAKLWFVVLMLLSIALIGYGTTPRPEHHVALRADGPINLIDAFDHALGWPVIGYHWAAFWIWLPTVAAVLVLLKKKTMTPTDLAMLGFAAWSVAQAAVVAYGRGRGLLELSSRYTELMTPGLIANAWFAVRLLGMGVSSRPAPKFAAWVIAGGYFIVVFAAFAFRFDSDMAAMADRKRLSDIQTQHVRSYLLTHDPAALRQPFLQIPYPDAARLQSLLDNKALRESLSPEIMQDNAAAQ
ncbi:MAG: hypothetical protein ACREO8_08065 [Luteimonas sp.]